MFDCQLFLIPGVPGIEDIGLGSVFCLVPLAWRRGIVLYIYIYRTEYPTIAKFNGIQWHCSLRNAAWQHNVTSHIDNSRIVIGSS